MLNTKSAILITLFFSTGQGKKHYTTTSVKTLLENLLKYHKIDIQRRWTFQCLRWLEDEKHIKREQRYINQNDGTIRQIPSMIIFRLKGIVQLVKMGVKGAKEIHKTMVTFLQKPDKRFPNRTDFDDGSWKPADPDERKRLNGLLGIVTKEIE